MVTYIFLLLFATLLFLVQILCKVDDQLTDLDIDIDEVPENHNSFFESICKQIPDKRISALDLRKSIKEIAETQPEIFADLQPNLDSFRYFMQYVSMDNVWDPTWEPLVIHLAVEPPLRLYVVLIRDDLPPLEAHEHIHTDAIIVRVGDFYKATKARG